MRRYSKEMTEGLTRLSRNVEQLWLEVEPVSGKLAVCCRETVDGTQVSDRVDEIVELFLSIFGEGSTTYHQHSASKGRGRKRGDGSDPRGSLLVRIFMEADQ